MNNHQLDIQKYSVKELFALFGLNDYSISESDLKKCKKIVLQMHPDKSHLGSEYFLFYKKAFQIIVEFYKSEHNIQSNTRDLYEESHHQSSEIKKQLQNISNKEFHNIFHEAFEKIQDNFRDNVSEGDDFWFTDFPNEMQVNYKCRFDSGKITPIAKPYVLSEDPLLHYEDIRKVYKDRVYLDDDIQASLDVHRRIQTKQEYEAERNAQNLTPFDINTSADILKNEKQTQINLLIMKEYQCKLNTLKYEEFNNSFLSQFLHLTAT